MAGCRSRRWVVVLDIGRVAVRRIGLEAAAPHIGLEAVVHRTDPAVVRRIDLAVEEAAHTGLEVAVRHTGLEEMVRRTGLEEALRTDPGVVHHIDLEAARRTVPVEEEHHIHRVQVSRHTGSVAAAGRSLAAADSRLGEDTVDSALVVVVDSSLAEAVRSLGVEELVSY